MDNRKIIFIAFAAEDVMQRDFLKGKSLQTHCPFEYVDMPVNATTDQDWKEKVRICISRSDAVIILVSRYSLSSVKQKWEIQCAQEEGKQMLSIWVYGIDRTTLNNIITREWTWETVQNFIDKA